ncbi:hypothetical protein [Halalkalirubrum salinum]|uniref:hypothetical protein n=1 Tax=Halalkalirubrum salinum TaxID=2563889 RepID=UPI0010BF711F|nr:hypothetical protein [Halalkalirubrum salinum]
MVAWAIYAGEHREAYCSSGTKGDDKEILGDTIALWTRDMTGLIDWDDAGKMASIAFYYSDLRERDIRSIFNDSGEGRNPGEPPWELQHPEEDDQVLKVQRE